MTDHLRAVATVVGLAAVASAAVTLGFEPAVAGSGGGMGRGMMTHQPLEGVLRLKLFVSTFTIVVVGALVWSYVNVYRELPNPFTGGLLVVTLALLFYALSSNPLVHVLLGFRPGVGLGPFTYLPDLFAALAAIVLLYQSQQ